MQRLDVAHTVGPTGLAARPHRRHVIEAMQRYTRLGAEGADDVALAVVVDAQIFRLEAVVRWLDAADPRLAGRSAATAPATVPDPTARPASPHRPAPSANRSEVRR